MAPHTSCLPLRASSSSVDIFLSHSAFVLIYRSLSVYAGEHYSCELLSYLQAATRIFHLPLGMAPSRRSQTGSWTSAEIPSGQDVSTVASLFQHDKRDADFPLMYRLNDQHPLRPSGFTASNYPTAHRDRFYDYVVTMKKEDDFMKRWQELGEKQETPNDHITSNQQMGMLFSLSC